MNTPDDDEVRLSELLRSEGDRIVAAGDGLARIQQRVAFRRRARLVVVPGAALATAAAVTAFFLIGSAGGTNSLKQEPPLNSGMPTSVCDPGACPTTSPTGTAVPTVSPPTAVDDYADAIWPFTSKAQADDWKADHGTRPWANDKQQLVQHFVTDYLGLKDVYAGEPCGTCTKVPLMDTPTPGASTADVGLVELTADQTGGGFNGPFSVLGVTSPTLKVTAPTAPITSPTTVGGTITGVDESIRLSLVTAEGKTIATGQTMAGSGAPWSASLTWTDTSWTRGALVATTGNARDGATNRVVVTLVTRQPTGSGTVTNDSFVGTNNGRVLLYSATTGKQTRQLTFPPAGFYDTDAAWTGRTLVWARSQQTGCASELDQSIDGTVSTLVARGSAILGSPRISDGGAWLAYVRTECAGGAQAVVVRHAGQDHEIAIPTAQSLTIEDVSDGGAVLISIGTTGSYTERVVTAVASSTDESVALAVTAGCTSTAGAYDGSDVVTWESCQSGTRLVRFTAPEAAPARDPVVAGLEAPTLTTVNSGRVLVWLTGGDSVGAVSRYTSGTLTTVVANGCPSTSAGTQDTCLRTPQW
jgi:hypothetical protein